MEEYCQTSLLTYPINVNDKEAQVGTQAPETSLLFKEMPYSVIKLLILSCLHHQTSSSIFLYITLGLEGSVEQMRSQKFSDYIDLILLKRKNTFL
ncbi:hypothetical protein ACTXT7_010080 [Hymenolepis weldensis]